MTAPIHHIPVGLHRVRQVAALTPGECVADLTLGAGHYAVALGEDIQPGGTLVAFDRDPDAIAASAGRFDHLAITVHVVQSNFAHLDARLDDLGIRFLDACVADLGVSSHQLDTGERGFSWRFDAPIDLRMGPDAKQTGAEVLATADATTLERIFRDLGDERFARRVVSAVVDARRKEPVATTVQFADLVSRAIPRAAHPRNIHPATKCMLGLRAFVNAEYESLAAGLEAAIRRLAPGGRVIVVTYHSIEHRITRKIMQHLSGKCVCDPGTPMCNCSPEKLLSSTSKRGEPITEEEVLVNPRSRSAAIHWAVRSLQ